ncbi:hypothetical protein Tco_0026554 [Tanacetum coccineum]
MSTLTFADTHNMVAFLEKPAESDGPYEIIDFLNANQFKCFNCQTLTSHILAFATFLATTKSSIRSDLHLADAGGIDCLPTATIFEELARMGQMMSSSKEIVGTKTSPKVGERKKKQYLREDASKQERIKIIDETQGRKIDEREVSTGVEDSVAPTIPVTTADEGVTAAKIDEITPTSAPTIIIDELTLAQTLIEIKPAKPKAVTNCEATTTPPYKTQARGVVDSRAKLNSNNNIIFHKASQPSKTRTKQSNNG